jgi:hypothetical protein
LKSLRASACFTARFRALLNEEQRTSKDHYSTATIASDGARHVGRGGGTKKNRPKLAVSLHTQMPQRRPEHQSGARGNVSDTPKE